MTVSSVASGTDTAVYTYGWDTAFVIAVADVNKAIVDHGASPKGFSQSDPDYTVTGDFDAWRITLGGDGKNIRVALPLRNIVLQYTASKKTTAFVSGQLIGELELHFVPHDAAANDADGKPYKLVVKPDATSETEPAFSAISLTLNPDPGDSSIAKAIVMTAIETWAKANLAQFAHVFSVVDLNRLVDQGQWGFVTPNYTSYAYLDAATVDTSLFAVLCMTGDRTGTGLSEQLNPAAIPPGSRAGFLVSPTRALYDLVRPAIMLAFPGLTDQNFLLSDDHTKLYLKEGVTVQLPPMDTHGSTYYPRLLSLSVTAFGNTFTLESYTETDVGPGLTAWCRTTHQYSIELGTSDNGQTLKFIESAPATKVSDVRQSEGSVITQLIIEIAAGIALIVLTIVTDGAALVVGGLIIGLIMGADQIIPAEIEKANTDSSPSLDLMRINAVDPIQWPDSKDFKLNYAALNVSLQLGGDPQFV